MKLLACQTREVCKLFLDDNPVIEGLDSIDRDDDRHVRAVASELIKERVEAIKMKVDSEN